MSTFEASSSGTTGGAVAAFFFFFSQDSAMEVLTAPAPTHCSLCSCSLWETLKVCQREGLDWSHPESQILAGDATGRARISDSVARRRGGRRSPRAGLLGFSFVSV